MSSQPAVSFCTTAMDRLHHLRQTFLQNIQWNQDCPNVEFVLLDYSSSDGISAWAESELAEPIDKGLVVFAQAPGFTEFRRSHAKNMAHRLAKGDIVCNLDADNYTGPGFAACLAAQFAETQKVFFRSGRNDGTTGRLAFRRAHFLALGGYDERMSCGWGKEDRDLCERAKAWGLREIVIPKHSPFLKAIDHDDCERVRHHPIKSRDESQRKNAAIMEENLRHGRLTVNSGQHWGAGEVLRNFTERLQL